MSLSYRSVLIAACLLISAPVFAAAESTIWSLNLPQSLCTVTSDTLAQNKCSEHWVIRNVMAQISYNVTVTNAVTGEIISRGATVPQGTKVNFTFVPHHSNDIYWFGTGEGRDSPYGDWVAGAAKPSTGICVEKNYFAMIGEDSNRYAYASLAVNPPTKSISGLPNGCTAQPDGVSMTCTLNNPGQIEALFTFAATQGKWYGAHGKTKPTVNPNGVVCSGDNFQNFALPLGAALTNTIKLDKNKRVSGTITGTYVLEVPQQVVNYTLNVLGDEQNGSAPTAPTVSAASLQCTTNSPYSISFHSTDPDNDNLRYGVDWDNNGSIDQFVPASGYVPSGTTLTASRTYTSAGQKTVRVLAQDVNGQWSSSTTFSFSCTAAPVPPQLENNNANEDSFSGNSGNLNDGNNNNNGNGAGNALGNLRATPSLVRTGVTSRVTWSTQGATSCSVTGTNGDSWTGLNGSRTSSPITQQTRYTLSCQTGSGTLTDTAVVNILPKVREF